MFDVLKVDGRIIMTDRGGVCILPFQYADGGKSHPVSAEDWRRMRDAFLALPALEEALLSCLHQLATDSDLGDLPGAPKYVALVQVLKEALFAADPGNPVLQGWYPPEKEE